MQVSYHLFFFIYYVLIMGAHKDLSVSFFRLTQEDLEAFYMECGIGLKYNPVSPGCDKSINQCPSGSIALYCRHFEFSNLLHPFSTFVLNVLCRASGYDPTLLLFRRFFGLVKNGDWLTFETSKVGTCLISSMGHPDSVLNEPEPHESDLNSCFLKAIRECPSRVWPFPKNLLVLLGISKLWDKPDLDPDVVFMDAQAAEGDDVPARGSEQRFEDVGCVSVPNVKGFTKTTAPKALTRLSAHRMLKSAAQSTSSDPVELSDDIEVSEGQGPDAEKEKNLVVLGKKKASGKKVTVTLVQGSTCKDIEGLSEDGVYVPNWCVKVGDSFKDVSVCADVLANFAPLGDRGSISEIECDTMLSRLILSSCNLSALVAKGVTRFQNGMQEYEEFSKKKEKMKASIAAMKRDIVGFSKKDEAWVKKVGELTRRHEIDIGDLKKSFEADKLKPKADREALDVHKKAFVEEKEGLKASIVQATGDNQWLIKQGFQQVVTYLLYSIEFNSALKDVYTKLLNYGKHLGLMERLTYPYVSEVSSFFGKSLSILQGLKPAGLNEKVCAEVLDSLSKKHSRSCDSEETFSEDANVSKEASLEGSTVADNGGPKAKKAKKAKKGKSDGSRASKP
ncbi:hypothetical protein Hanom_Chr05g00407271 [Helianthus anomalus]